MGRNFSNMGRLGLKISAIDATRRAVSELYLVTPWTTSEARLKSIFGGISADFGKKGQIVSSANLTRMSI